MARQAEVSHERGRFVLGPSGHPRFAGSSTGIYLADTVWTEVSPIAADAADLDEAFVHRNDRPAGSAQDNDNNNNSNPEATATSPSISDDPILDAAAFLEQEEAREHFADYFRLWHPLFPFLDGRLLSQKLEDAFLLARNLSIGAGANWPGAPAGLSGYPAFPNLNRDEALVYSTIFRAVITLGSIRSTFSGEQAGSSSIGPAGARDRLHDLRSPRQAMFLAHLIVSACQGSRISEILALQGLLAIQVVLFGLRETRPAMHIGGLLTKIAFEAGLHRCPNRYLRTFHSAEDRDLRKRIFYSLYSLERLLAAEFGIPLTMNDTDIDTCLPGDLEQHQIADDSPSRVRKSVLRGGESSGTSRHPDPIGTPKRGRETSVGRQEEPSSKRLRKEIPRLSPEASLETQQLAIPASASQAQLPMNSADLDGEALKNARLQPALALTRMTRMVGRAMETFNKSLKSRHGHDQSTDALSLRVELDQWWNGIGFDPDHDHDDTDDPGEDPHLRGFSVLFTCLYYQQIVNLARPMLSLSPTSVQHALALQSSINAVRTICSTLSRSMKQNFEALHWPGYVDMVFFGSLILVYGARKEGNRPSTLKLLKRDLSRIHRLLKQFDARWQNLKPLIRIVDAFLAPLGSTTEGVSRSDRTSQRDPDENGGPSRPAQDESSGPAFQFPLQDSGFQVDPVSGDFFFDFDSFELHPATMWAYRPSIPNSPR